MSASSSFLTIFFHWLNEAAPYAVMRNYEGLPDNNKSRDIDIAIRQRDYLRIRRPLLFLVEREGWQLVTFYKSDRLITWVVGYLAPDHTTELIQLDFFFHTSVFGIRLLDIEKCINDRKQLPSGVFAVSATSEFLDKYLYNRAVGAAYPARYGALRERVEHHDRVKKYLKKAFGVSSVEKADALSSRRLVGYAFFSQLFSRPLVLLGGLASFLYYRVRGYCVAPAGFTVGFTGPDGSGKTTVLERLQQRLGVVFAKAQDTYHFRPTLWGNLSEVAHHAGLKKEVDRNYSDPHRGGHTGVLSSLSRLLFYTADYVLGYFVKVKPAIRITRLVFFDRYFTDIICDSRRTSVCLPYRFLYRFGRLFIPQLHYNILLTAPTDVILSRKQELQPDDIADINTKIDFLATQKGYLKVNNTGTADEAVTTILQHIFREQHNKLRRMI